MNETDWQNWLAVHATLFDMRKPDYRDMFVLWRALLTDFSHDELLDATKWLAGHKEGAYPSNHLELLGRRIRWCRAEAVRLRQATAEAEAQRYDCQVCHSTGIVAVPHPTAVLGGVWRRPYYTAGVACSCLRGRLCLERSYNRAQKSEGRQLPLMAIEAYEQRVPNWQVLQNQLADLIREREASEAAQRSAGPIDLAQVRQRYQRMFHMPDEVP